MQRSGEATEFAYYGRVNSHEVHQWLRETLEVFVLNLRHWMAFSMATPKNDPLPILSPT